MSEREIENALPSIFYRDPAEALDEIHRLRDAAKRMADRDRKHKSRRIQALVRKVMREGGDTHGGNRK